MKKIFKVFGFLVVVLLLSGGGDALAQVGTFTKVRVRDSVVSLGTNTDLVLRGNGSGVVNVDDPLEGTSATFTGNVDFTGTKGTLNVNTNLTNDNVILSISDAATTLAIQSLGVGSDVGIYADNDVVIRTSGSDPHTTFNNDGSTTFSGQINSGRIVATGTFGSSSGLVIDNTGTAGDERAIRTQLTSTGTYHLICTTNGVEKVLIEADGSATFGGNVTIDNGASNTVGASTNIYFKGASSSTTDLSYIQQGVGKLDFWGYSGSAWRNNFSINNATSAATFSGGVSYTGQLVQNITTAMSGLFAAEFRNVSSSGSGVYIQAGGTGSRLALSVNNYANTNLMEIKASDGAASFVGALSAANGLYDINSAGQTTLNLNTSGVSMSILNSNSSNASGLLVSAGGGSGTYVVRFNNYAGTQAFNIDRDLDAQFSGDVTAADFILSSDIRYKTKTGDLGGDKIKYISYTREDGRERFGVSAQQVREVYPSAVTEDSDGKLAVSYIDVYALEIAQLHSEVRLLALALGIVSIVFVFSFVILVRIKS